MLVTVYTRTTCAPCKTVKWYLEKKGVPFEEKNIDDKDNFNEYVEESKKSGHTNMVPLVVFGDAHISGLNMPALAKCVDFYLQKTSNVV